MILQNVIRLCRERGVSVSKLEKETGIGNGTICRWKKSFPRVDILKKVADYFGVSVDSLLVDREEDSR